MKALLFNPAVVASAGVAPATGDTQSATFHSQSTIVLASKEEEGAVRIATSAFRFGMACPSLFSDPKQREYQALLPGAKWTDLAKEGVETAVALSAGKSTGVNYIQSVVRIPDGFENVKTIEFAPEEVTFVSITGKLVTVPVRHEFLKTGKL